MNRFVQQANSVIGFRRHGVGCGKIDDEDDDVKNVRPEGHAPQNLCECWMARRAMVEAREVSVFRGPVSGPRKCVRCVRTLSGGRPLSSA